MIMEWHCAEKRVKEEHVFLRRRRSWLKNNDAWGRLHELLLKRNRILRASV